MGAKAVARAVSANEVGSRSAPVAREVPVPTAPKTATPAGLSILVVPDQVMVSLLELSARENKTVAALVAEGLGQYLEKKGIKKPETALRDLAKIVTQEK